MNPTPPPNQARWQPVAAACAWVLPGLGHIVIGEKKRGLIVMIAILTLFALGAVIGGIGVINSHTIQPNERNQGGKRNLWFFAQAMVSPAVLPLELKRDQWDRQAKLTPSIGRIHEIGTLYCAMAGLLNLLAIIDVVYRGAPHKPEPQAPALRGRVVTREDAP